MTWRCLHSQVLLPPPTLTQKWEASFRSESKDARIFASGSFATEWIMWHEELRPPAACRTARESGPRPSSMSSSVSDSTSIDMTLTSVGGSSLVSREGDALVALVGALLRAFAEGRGRSSWALPLTEPSTRRRGEEPTISTSGVAGWKRVRERAGGGIVDAFK